MDEKNLVNEEKIEINDVSESQNDLFNDALDKKFNERWAQEEAKLEAKLKQSIISEYLKPQLKDVKEENIEIKPKERSLFF